MLKRLPLAALAASLVLVGPALAQPGGHHDSRGGGGYHGQGGGRDSATPQDFHGRDMGRLSPGERAHWGGGEWRHTWHGGRFGWWWFLDDDWYFYPQPLYPYPTYIAPLDEEDAGPPPMMPPPQHFWYRCANPSGFYPYVTTCPDGWQPVPATPPELAPRRAPGPPPEPGSPPDASDGPPPPPPPPPGN